MASTNSYSRLGTVLQTCALRAPEPHVPTLLHKANQEDYKANKEVGNQFDKIDWCRHGLLVHTQGLPQWLCALSIISQHYRDGLNPMISLFRGPSPSVPVFLTPYWNVFCITFGHINNGWEVWKGNVEGRGGGSNLETAPVK